MLNIYHNWVLQVQKGTICDSQQQEETCVYICLMTTVHLNTIWLQQLLRKIVSSLLAPWETIITDKIEKTINDNSRLCLSVCDLSGILHLIYNSSDIISHLKFLWSIYPWTHQISLKWRFDLHGIQKSPLYT